MPPDLRDVLRGAAAVPRTPLDFDHALARGSWRRRARHVGVGVGVILVLLGLVAPLVGSSRPEPDEPGPIVATIPRPTVGPSPGPSPTQAVAPSPGPFGRLPAGWTELVAPPEMRRHGAIAWTGETLLMWG